MRFREVPQRRHPASTGSRPYHSAPRSGR
jgi:hypothetical protein